MQKQILLTDIDGVVLDYVRSFGDFLVEKGHKLEKALPETWSMLDWVPSLSKSQVEDLIFEFNNSETFGQLKAFEDALHILPQLAERYDLVAVTSCSADVQVQNRRIANLENHGFNFSKVVCLPLNVPKVESLKKFQPSIWVEDRYEGALAGLEAGHERVFLRRTLYTPKVIDPRIILVNNWIEIASHLQN